MMEKQTINAQRFSDLYAIVRDSSEHNELWAEFAEKIEDLEHRDLGQPYFVKLIVDESAYFSAAVFEKQTEGKKAFTVIDKNGNYSEIKRDVNAKEAAEIHYIRHEKDACLQVKKEVFNDNRSFGGFVGLIKAMFKDK